MNHPIKHVAGYGDVVQEVGGTTFRAAHAHNKPLEFGALGHYRVSHRTALVNTQAANSRLFTLQNNGANLIIPTRLRVSWLQTAAHTAAIEDSIDIYKVTGFTVVDSVNTITPTATRMRGSNMAAAPGAAVVRAVTVAGAAAGMTGGTLTKDGGPLGQLPQWLLAAVPTASQVAPVFMDFFFEDCDEHPPVFAQNEGLIIENRVLLGAAAGATVYIDLAWAEVAAY